MAKSKEKAKDKDKNNKKTKTTKKEPYTLDANNNIIEKRIVVTNAGGKKITITSKLINVFNGMDADGKIRFASKVAFSDLGSSLKRAFLIFMFYSFIGTLAENFVEIVINHWYYMPREFFRLPICPIFGIGAIILFMFFDGFLSDPRNDMWKKIIVVFVGSVIITSIIEYITSYILEATTGTWPWKAYENMPFNLGGRICLFNSLGFGILSTFCILWVQPRFEYWLLCKVEKHTFDIIFWVVFIAFVVDLFLAIKYPTGVDLSKPRESWAMIEIITRTGVLV